ncbi:DinB family protein [Nocardioides sp. NPDC057772]|uniref:mycothiol transferase n=1 Tax=Nocardioides sp. NPDC057772 TaxID=3346245 RepID=UPI00366CCE9A
MSDTWPQRLLADGFGRIAESLPAIVDGLSVDDLLWRPYDRANSIAWTLWHIGRMEDAQIAPLAGTDEVWARDGWVERFGLPYRPRAMGYGQSAEEVGAFRLEDPALLTGYYRAVHAATLDLVESLSEEDLARVIDERWDPPVTTAVRLVSIVDDAAQHIGQAAYVKGLLSLR